MRSLIATFVGLLCGVSASQAQPWDLDAWRNRAEVEITEPGATSLTDEYVDLLLDFSSGPTGNLANDIRVLDAAGTELPRVVYSLEGETARVLFPMPSLPLGETETVFVYWGNDAALAPGQTFPPIQVIYYTTNPAAPHPVDDNQIAGLTAMTAHGEIPVAPNVVAGDSAPYDREQALAHRVAAIGLDCTIHSNLNTSTIYQDVPLWGFTNGNCLEERIFGLTNGPDPSLEARVPQTLGYITQDFAPDELLDFTCSETAEP
ncbi:MAG: hypothetical protein OEP95_03970, partial [Myxococcales bacterium]|nr:hypothetical protein [Myxococcales bacterium]